jgi:hypothetical protein
MEEHEAAPAKQQAKPADAIRSSTLSADSPADEPATDLEGGGKPKRMGKSDKIMLWATAVIAAGTIVSAGAIVLQWREMVGGGGQTDQLIKAANINACAADQIAAASKRNATAAELFSKSSADISKSMNVAVVKLNLQAGALRDSVQQASRLAEATEKANRLASDADRPWIGAALEVIDWEAGKSPRFVLTFTNSGRRPAIVDRIASHGSFYASYPVNPEADYSVQGSYSTSLVVPGANQRADGRTVGPISKEQLDAANEGIVTYFAFAEVQYRDVRDNKRHWLHVCYRYDPKAGKEFLSGFRECHEYNDTDKN